MTFPPYPNAPARLYLAALLLLTGAGCTSPREVPPSDPNEELWTQLFDGESLEGWTPKIRGHAPGVNFGNTFRVEDGLLKVRYDAYDRFDERFGHLFYESPFSHYRLRIEYRFVEDQVAGGPGWAVRNSGVMFHGQPSETMGTDQDFPISIEAQLLGGTGSGERTTMNLCTPGTHVVMAGELVTRHCVSSDSETYHGERWVHAELLVLGDSVVHHIVEGDTVLTYTNPQIGGGNVDGFDPAQKRDGAPLRRGTISLQSESHPIDFRKVELLNLEGCTDPQASNYKSYYVASAPGTCR